MMTRSIGCAALVAALTAATAWSQPYYARGDFNGWDTSNQLTEITPTHYMGTITGQTTGNMPEYKIATADWNASWPGSNGKVIVDGAGEITFHFYPDTFADGWQPTANRVGYDDPGQHGWDIMGSFNGWSTPILVLTDVGGGHYSGHAIIPTPGIYEFKFRKDNDWAIAIGDDFGNSAANNTVETTAANQLVQFDLDLPNGRWRVEALPPGIPTVTQWGVVALVLLLVTAGTLLFRRRVTAAANA